MRRIILPVLVASIGLVVGACSSEASDKSTETTAPSSSVAAETKSDTTHSEAEKIKAKIPQVTKLIEITEDNDGNDLIGRPNGYEQATVLVDTRAECVDGKPGVACGAVIELWPSEAAAEKRKQYVQKLQESSPLLGSEYDTVKGPMLLRVSGDLKPSQAKVYERVFVG